MIELYRGSSWVPVSFFCIALLVCCPGSGSADETRQAPHSSLDTASATVAAYSAESAESAATQRYDFGGATHEALAAYRRGWVAILRDGRWTEAERLYREALTRDPDFTIAKSVLARITRDGEERDALYREVQAEWDTVDAAARLILHTYQKTLELFALRETGTAPSAGERRAMAERAVQDYGAFLARYPREWSVMIEYIEWVHALDGPAAALEAIEVLRASAEGASGEGMSREGTSRENTTEKNTSEKNTSEKDPTDFSYFPAWFHAELGELATARRLAVAFRARISNPESPQPAFLDAYLYFEAGELEAAAESVQQALALDPRHLLAERLRQRIESARSPQT